MNIKKFAMVTGLSVTFAMLGCAGDALADVSRQTVCVFGLREAGNDARSSMNDCTIVTYERKELEPGVDEEINITPVGTDFTLQFFYKRGNWYVSIEGEEVVFPAQKQSDYIGGRLVNCFLSSSSTESIGVCYPVTGNR